MLYLFSLDLQVITEIIESGSPTTLLTVIRTYFLPILNSSVLHRECNNKSTYYRTYFFLKILNVFVVEINRRINHLQFSFHLL